MNNEITDKKLEHLTIEVMEFYEFIRAMARKFNQESYEINQFEIAKKIGDFYDKNSTKYNNTQIVYQFIMHVNKRDKHVMEMYREFKRAKSSL